jgi:predicted nucleic acid-binding protein
MMDVVIDTCTLVHADNPDSDYFEHSVEFVNKMFSNTILCTVDDGFTLDEATHSSYIALEYLKHLRPTSLGYYLIYHLAQSMRLNFVSKDIPNAHKNFMEQIIVNKKDIHFLRVTYNSNDKVLVTHDFEDYQKRKRKVIRRNLGLSLVTAEEINGEI